MLDHISTEPITFAIYESVNIYRQLIHKYGLKNKQVIAYSGALNHVIRQFDSFIGGLYISKEAAKQIRVENPFGLNWSKRQIVNAHYEHCIPIKDIKEGLLKCKSFEETHEFLKKNVIVCWITDAENKLLTNAGYRSKRPGGYLRCYLEVGIEILNETDFLKLCKEN